MSEYAKPKISRVLAGLFVLAALLALGFLFYKLYFSGEAKIARQKAALPEAQTAAPPAAEGEDPPLPAVSSPESEPEAPLIVPEELNHGVPFTSQAPHGDWSALHQDACEEAAVLMAGRFFQGRSIDGPADADAALREIVAWQMEHFGYFESTDAEQTAEIARGVYSLKAEVLPNPTVDGIKKAIAEGRLVLVPAAGRQLKNPFYKSPGPLYHMLLIRGYTKDKFITNDPGTKRGENYPYDFDVVLGANRDWNGGNVEGGARKIIVVYQ